MFRRFEKPSHDELRVILSYLPADDRETWFKTFAIVGREYGPADNTAFAICQDWARGYAGRKREDESKERIEYFDSSRRAGPGIGALIKQAKARGYTPKHSQNESVHVHGASNSAIEGLKVLPYAPAIEPPKNPLQNGLYASAQNLAQSALKYWMWIEDVPASKRGSFMRRYAKAYDKLPITEGAYLKLLAEFCDKRALYSFDAFTEWAEERYVDFSRDELVTLLSQAQMSPNYEAAEDALNKAITASWQLSLQKQVEQLATLMNSQNITVEQAKELRNKLIEVTEPFNPQIPALTGHDITPVGRRCVTELLDPELSARYYTKSGYPLIDKYTYGWRRGDVTIVGAHSGIGKTWFGVDACNQVIANGGNVLFITTEMSQEDIVLRQYLNVGRASITDLESSSYQAEMINAISKDNEAFYSRDECIHVMYATTLTNVISAILSKADLFNIDLIVVDYIQNIENDMCAYTDPMHQKVKNTMERLLQTAKKCACPIIALAQLNNPNRKPGANQEPNLYDMGSASYIVQDAAAVMVMYKIDMGPDASKELRFKVVKSRHGMLPEQPFKVHRNAGAGFEFTES